jgi:hypothetical protein
VDTDAEYMGGMDGVSSFGLLLRVTDQAGAVVTDDIFVNDTGFGECFQ